MVALLFCADSIAAVFKGSRDPDPALLGTNKIAHPLASTCDVALYYICEIRSVIVYSFTRSNIYMRSQNLKIRP